MMQLETDRLLLRDWQISDWRQAHAYASDPRVSRFMVWGPNTERETLEFVRNCVDTAKEKPRRYYELAILPKAGMSVIGGCGMRLTGTDDRTAMIGYVLHPDHWGNGYIPEVVRRVMRFGFEELGLHRIYATCDVENSASERVMHKCGMRKEAHFVEDMLIRGLWRDSYLYAILDREFFS